MLCRHLALPALLAFAALASGCEKTSPAKAREWTPADHHSQDDDRSPAAPADSDMRPRGTPGASTTTRDDATQLVELAWRQQCASCHGATGHGDGPMGAMLQAPDLTQRAWQAKASDADIAAVIQTGKNKMPKFDLPDVVVKGLVARIRSLKGT
jgi:mono/diheme cytochrome c family protein